MIRRIIPALTVAALLGACSSTTANTPEPGAPAPSRTANDRGPGGRDDRDGRRGGGREEMLMRSITLSTEQRTKIDSIRAAYRTQMQQDREQGTMDRTAMRARMQRQQADIRAVLTSEQQAQFDRNVAEMRDRMQQGGGRRPNG